MPIEKIVNRYSTHVILICFLLLLTSNSLLSYSTLSLDLNIWVSFLGIILPLITCLLLYKKQDPFEAETLPRIPAWIWAFFGIMAVFLRFFHLTRFTPWPVADEGLFGYFATLQREHWDWRVLHDFRTTPLVYSWGLALCFKTFGESLSTLWFFSACISTACVPLLWLACRKSFSRSLTFIFFVLVSVSFWPIYMGRFSTQCILLVFWECLTLLSLSRYLAASRGTQKHGRLRLLLLAVLTGLGFYIYLAWPFVALIVGLTLLFSRSPNLAERGKVIFIFMGTVVLTVIPLLFEFAKQYQGYFQHLWVLGTPHSFLYRMQLPIACLKDFFWGNSDANFHFGPVWGGLLNPALTSLAFIGCIDLARSIRNSKSLWVFAAFFSLFLPALLTNNFELMRLSPMPPLLVFLSALGAQSLLARLPSGKKAFFLFSVLLFSMAFDLTHLFYVYPNDWAKNVKAYEGHKSPEFYQAYSILNSIAQREGPGLILLNFHPDPYDQTLFVATYDFNAAENPRLNRSNAHWAAVLSNIHEQPFLSKLFPEGKWYWLSEGLSRRDGGFLLEVLPLNAGNRGKWDRWVDADQSLKDLTRMIVELGVDPDQADMLGVLEKAYPLFQNDPLLESRYWRIMALHHCAGGNPAEGIKDYEKALAKGFPQAHLYNDMGCLLFRENRLREARVAFESALRSKPNCTNADENLKNLLLSNRTQ